MIEIAELLEPEPRREWDLLRQVGVSRVVGLLEDGEQRRRWLRSASADSASLLSDQTAPPRGRRCWELPALQRLRDLYQGSGLQLVALEDTPPMDLVRLGAEGRDQQIEWFCDMLRLLPQIGVHTLCYNWMAVGSWARTDVEVPARGGALLSGYDDAVMRTAAPMIEPGSLTAEQLWQNLGYFLRAVVPVAAEAGVRIGMHPDDPPLTEVRGVPRIINSLDAYDRLLQTVPSPSSGITFCQGNFRLMTGDIPGAIHHFGSHIVFVHFRDVAGTAEKFVETFHDLGPTDLLACMEAYRDIAFEGVLRPDHVATLSGESNDRPGYAFLARLHAVGYIAGLREAAYGKAAVLSEASP